jgi:hypothetical protein
LLTVLTQGELCQRTVALVALARTALMSDWFEPFIAQLPKSSGPNASHGPLLGQLRVLGVQLTPPLVVTSVSINP